MKRLKIATRNPGRVILAVALPGLVPVLLAVGGCGSQANPWEGKGGSPRVVATFAPLAAFTRAVAGDDAAIVSLCTTSGPHRYRPDHHAALYFIEADLFVANGLGLDDHFADRFNGNSGNERLRYRKLAESLTENERKKNKDFDPNRPHVHADDGECCGGHGPFDPHAWLGILQVIRMVGHLRDDLKAVDPARAADYDRRAAEFIGKLEALQTEGKEKLKGLDAALVTGHESMGYFADTFGLNPVGSFRNVIGQQADQQQFVELLKKCEPHARVVIAVEPQFPRTDAENLKEELLKRNPGREVHIVELDPMETCAPDAKLDGEWYLNGMRGNIEVLAKLMQ